MGTDPAPHRPRRHLDDLETRAEQVCQRVTGLLEPLRLVEVDAPRQSALLRSEQPGQRGDERFYYEVLLDGDGGATVRRYPDAACGRTAPPASRLHAHSRSAGQAGPRS